MFVDAGTLAPGFTLANDGVEFFCHSPFVKHCADGDIIRNEAALVFNVRFRVAGAQFDFLAVGDADWEALEDIVVATRAHKNEDQAGVISQWFFVGLAPIRTSCYSVFENKLLANCSHTPTQRVRVLMRPPGLC